jgi:hypothetical protein
MWKRAYGWSDKPLSRAGKEVMLKAVVQAIPIYVMSCFRLPIGICDKMRSTVSNHWWGFENGKKKLHWRSWDWLTAPKALGGMGFRDMELFNQALLAKQCWRLLTVPDSLCAKVLKGRYYPNSTFWQAGNTRSASYTWRSLMYGKKILISGVLWRVGNGRTISLTRDHWIPGVLHQLAQPIIPIPEDLKLNFLIDEQHKQWKEELVRACYSEENANMILKIPLSHNTCEDFVSWEHNKEGIFTVKSAYMFAKSEKLFLFSSTNGKGGASNIKQITEDWKHIWKVNAPEKMKIVLWRLAHDCLPTGQQLLCRHIPVSDACCYCGQMETVVHAILKCQYVTEIWREMKKWCGIKRKLNSFISPKQWLFDYLSECI